MKKHLKKAISALLVIVMILSIVPISAFAAKPATKSPVKDTAYFQNVINELYESEAGTVGRVHKMQAFIMEIALRAKSQNPDFQIIPQDGIDLAYVDGDTEKGLDPNMMALIDGWGIEGMVGSSASLIPNSNQQAYINLVKAGKYVSDTTSVKTREQLNNYYARAKAWGIIPYPRIGGDLAQSMFPGWRWATNGDYFWVDSLDTIGLSDRADGTRVVNKLTDAQNYLYNINGRPYDVWETWDAEEAEYEEGDGDRTRIDDSYGCGLLVPSAGGPYKPVGDNETLVNKAIATYGEEWDWWWRAAGLDESAGRETWLNALRNSDYDVIYIDSFYNHRALPENQTPLTREEVESLKVKPDGGTRKVIAYLSIGSAEQNRWYCQDDWTWIDPSNPNSYRSMKAGKVSRVNGTRVYTPYTPPEGEAAAPNWLAFGYGGNYPEEAVVAWWTPEWRSIIVNGGGDICHKTTGDNTSSVDRIVAQGFDGVYLDNVGVFDSSNWTYYEKYWQENGGIPGYKAKGAVVDQGLDYTETTEDVPNPDRGFYRASDGMIVPVEGEGTGSVEVGAQAKKLCGVTINTTLTHMSFDLRNFSSNSLTARGTRYTRNYRAPDNISIKSRGDPEPWDYETNFDYWKANVVPTWPHGTTAPISEDGLAYIRAKLQEVRDGKGTVVLRFSYDSPGYSWVDCEHPQDGYIDQLVWDVEPDKETVLMHIAQLKPILYEYRDVITAVDGGFFGPWGEMHSTTFGTSVSAYAWLLNALLDAVPDDKHIVVQPGAFLSWYNTYYKTHYTFATIDQIPEPVVGTPESRFGLFNDSYAFGTDDEEWPPDDWGSLGEGTSWPGNPLGTIEEDYDRGKIMTWLHNQNSFYGGEAQGDETLWNTYPFVAWEASYAHTGYLNADYSREVHQRWADFEYTEENVMVKMENAYNEPYTTEYAIYDPVYEGKNGLEYWRDRLGYRLVLRAAAASEWVAQDGTLVFKGKIQNVGFGNIVSKKNVTVILKNKDDGAVYTWLSTLDARDWLTDLDSRATNTAAYRDLSFAVKLEEFGEVPAGEYDILLKINDPYEKSANKRSIRFANNGEGIWDEELGANLIGRTTVVLGDVEHDIVAQKLDYTENPVDIPNPDRGFERGNDDAAGCGANNGLYGYMTVPASEDTILGQTFQMAYENTPELYLGGPTATPETCNVPVTPNIVQFYLVLNNFSSNAWCDSEPGNPSAHNRVGEDGPITEYGLNFIRQQFEFIRNNTNSVAHIRVCYDPKGWNQYVWTADNLLYEDLEGGGSNRYYYQADYTKPVAEEDRAAHIAKPVAGTWRGSSPVFRQCTVPGYEDLNWVQYHYLQLKPIFEEYADVIWAFDSGTFGPWGETHSNYEAEVPGHYKMVIDCLLDAVPDNKPILTHIGGFLDWYNRTYNTTYTFGTLDEFPEIVRGTPESRIGMFDDSNGFSADEYSYGDNGSLTEGYRMLAHDPLLPGYDPEAIDPSLTREQEEAPGGKVSSVIGYNTTGTNRLMPVPEELDDPRWRGVWFVDWDRTKVMNFLGKMSLYGGEQIGTEPAAGNNGKYVPVGERLLPENEDVNDVILRFPSMFYEHSIARFTYLCMQQGSRSFKSRADIVYNEENIAVEITYPWNGQTVKILYDPVYEGQSALAYYRDRLGYRLVLREANADNWVMSNSTLHFDGKIQNVGWGDIYNKKAVKVILKNPKAGFVSQAVLTDIDPHDWQPAEQGPNGEMPDSRATNTAAWRDLSFAIPMEEFGELPAGEYDIYLKITDPKETTMNKRSIRFANNGDMWDAEIGANKIGKTLVKEGTCEHKYIEDTAQYVAPTCVAAGKNVFVCKNCGDTYEEETAALCHDLIRAVGKTATCTEAGITAEAHCTRCDYAVAAVEIPALGHEYTASVTKEPTATEEGELTYKCIRCDDAYTEAIAKGTLVDQTDIDFTEDPVDIPNPDRGFYRANDGMVVPVEGEGEGTVEVGEEPKQLCGVEINTALSHMYFDLRNFSSNAFTGRGTRYNRNYRAPADVSIKSRGDAEPWDYDTHFDYWVANEVPNWPHGESQPLTEDALNYIRDKLQQVRDGHGTVIVRFNYDGPGYSWVDTNHPQDGYIDRLVQDIEPDKEMILTHIAQLKPILAEYEDVITAVDGGIFGPWGEMHSTTFGTSVEAYSWLLDAWLDAVPESRSIIVQGGAFLSWYNTRYGTDYTFATIDQIPAPLPGTAEARFGFFNDSYAFGTDDEEWPPDDWGSLGEGSSWPGNPLGTTEEDYDRGKVMTWIRNQNNFYGGEAQGDETLWNTYPFVAWEASYAQTVYLNADYSREVHQRWADFEYTEENVMVQMENAYNEPYTTEYAIFDPVYEGRNGLEYWRDRLGYRLVLRSARASDTVAPDGTLVYSGKIQNVGFGNIVNRKNVTVILKNREDGTLFTCLTDIDARLWRPDLDSRATNTDAYRDLSFAIKLEDFGEVPEGEYDIYLRINDPKALTDNTRCIRFANKGEIWDADLGANRIGSTVVAEAVAPKDPCEGYTDINRDLWYHSAVDFVIENGYMGSTSTDALTFEPNTKVTRAMVASIMYRIAGNPAVEYKASFTDVKEGKWFTDAIEWAAQNGLAAGKGDGKFDPNGNVTRQELAVFMYKLAEFQGKDVSAADDLANFADAAKVPAWAKAYVQWAVAAGLISGKGQKDGTTLLAPVDNATRAEFASIIMRFVG